MGRQMDENEAAVLAAVGVGVAKSAFEVAGLETAAGAWGAAGTSLGSAVAASGAGVPLAASAGAIISGVSTATTAAVSTVATAGTAVAGAATAAAGTAAAVATTVTGAAIAAAPIAIPLLAGAFICKKLFGKKKDED